MIKITEITKEIKRIQENEEKLDKLTKIVNNLENSLNEFEEALSLLEELNEYYGSQEWFYDKELYEKGKIERVKAGVLSEDAVWNLITDVKYLEEKMKEIKTLKPREEGENKVYTHK